MRTERRRRPYFPKGTFFGDVSVSVSPWLPFLTKTVLCMFLKGKEAVVKKLGKYAICFFFSRVLSSSNSSATVLSSGTRLDSFVTSEIFFLPMILEVTVLLNYYISSVFVIPLFETTILPAFDSRRI